jgi:hypothetical protein
VYNKEVTELNKWGEYKDGIWDKMCNPFWPMA